jgi:hypothetical protein
MNNIKNSTMVMLSYLQYSNAYELDYGSHVIIMIYELAYICMLWAWHVELYAIIHITYMSRIRAKLRWRFIVPSGVPKFFTCRSVGSGTWGNLDSSCVRKHGACVWTNRWIHFLLSGWGVGGRWWQSCLSLVILHVRVGCRSLNYHMRLLANQYSVASWLILRSVLTLTM